MAKSKARAKNKKKGGTPPNKNQIKILPLGRVGEIVFYSVIMFILGVLTGRGTAPVHFEPSHEKELKALSRSDERQKPVKVKVDFHNKLPLDGDVTIDDKLVKKYEKIPVKSPRFQKDRKRAKVATPLSDDKKQETQTVSNGSVKQKEIEKNKKQEAKPVDFKYTIQVAALKERSDAEDLASKIRSSGFSAYSVSGVSDSGVVWHRVRVGKFQKKESAEKLKKELMAKLNISGYLLKVN